MPAPHSPPAATPTSLEAILAELDALQAQPLGVPSPPASPLGAPAGGDAAQGAAVSAAARDPLAEEPSDAIPPAYRYRVGAGHLREALNALITREIGYHVQASARTKRPLGALDIRVACGAEGIRLTSQDGRVSVTVAAKHVAEHGGARGGEAHFVVNAEAFEAATERYAGATPEPDVVLVLDASPDGLAVERDGPPAVSGKARVLAGLLAAVLRPEAPCHLPLPLAWGIRALAIGDARGEDPSLQAVIAQVNAAVEARAHEMWRVELPKWTRALADVFPSADAEADARLLGLADATLAAGLDADDMDEMAAMTLTAGLIERRQVLAMAVVAPVPLNALAQSVDPAQPPLGPLLPSETARLAVFAQSPVVRALQPVLLAHGDASTVVAQLDRYRPVFGEEERRDAAKLAQGKVREANRAYADRLATFSAAVLGAALVGHNHPNAESRLAMMDSDTRTEAEHLGDLWPSLGGEPLPESVLEDISDQLDERLSLPDDIRLRTEKSNALRTASARGKRETSVASYFPDPEADVPWRTHVPGAAPVTGRVQPMTEDDAAIPLLLPPVALGGHAVERVAPVVVHAASHTALVGTPGLTALWCPKIRGKPALAEQAVEALIRATPPRGVVPGAVALTGDELLFAHAIANADRRNVAGKEPGAGVSVELVARDGELVLRLAPGAEIRLPLQRGAIAADVLRGSLADLQTIGAASRTQARAATDLFVAHDGADFRDPVVLTGVSGHAASAQLAELAEGTLRGRALRGRITPDVADQAIQTGRADDVQMQLAIDAQSGRVELTSAGARGIRRERILGEDGGHATGGAVEPTPVAPTALANALETARAGATSTSDVLLQPALTGAPLLLLREHLVMVVRPVSRVADPRDGALGQPATARAIATRMADGEAVTA